MIFVETRGSSAEHQTIRTSTKKKLNEKFSVAVVFAWIFFRILCALFTLYFSLFCRRLCSLTGKKS